MRLQLLLPRGRVSQARHSGVAALLRAQGLHRGAGHHGERASADAAAYRAEESTIGAGVPVRTVRPWLGWGQTVFALGAYWLEAKGLRPALIPLPLIGFSTPHALRP